MTYISSSFTLQVSDRLVSGGVHDPFANKNIIYWADGALVTIGYTGIAYELSSSNRNMPTDEWIAEKLRGNPIARGLDGTAPAFASHERVAKRLDIGQSVELLRTELQKSLSGLPLSHRKLPFEVIIAGWQATRHFRLRPIIIQICKGPGDGPVMIQRPQRYWHLRGRFKVFSTPGGYLRHDEGISLVNKLRFVSPNEAENLLVNTILDVSAKNPSRVGSHCMSILLPPPGRAAIRVRFIPTAPHYTTRTRNNMISKIPIAFSPWIIGPNTTYAPAEMNGINKIKLGSHEIVIEAPKEDKGIGLIESLHRPSFPKT